MTDEQLHQRATAFASSNDVSYTQALYAVQRQERSGITEEGVRAAFAEGRTLTEQQLVDFAEIEALKRHIPMEQALVEAATEQQHSAGARRFYAAVSRGELPSDADFNDAAMVLSAKGDTSYSEALGHLARTAEFGDAGHANDAAFAEGREVTDSMVHGAALAHSARTGADYTRSLQYVVALMPGAAMAGFAEAAAAAPSGQGPEIEIFRAGTHIDNGGNRHTFSVEDVLRMAQVYDPSKREAPMVKGHPADDAPSYGWIKSLRATEDGKLMAQGDQWDPAFLDELKAGRYKKRSASFYTPTHPNNPAPGTWYLRHLGWLGAQQPAVAGLANAAFVAPDVDQVSFTL